MTYKLVDGKPLVYSVGSDLDDDGGAFPFPKPGVGKPVSFIGGNELAIGQDDSRFDGDWILYPEPRVEAPEDDEAPATEPTTQPGQ